MCRLAHIALPEEQMQEATEVMTQQADSELLWIVRVSRLQYIVPGSSTKI